MLTDGKSSPGDEFEWFRKQVEHQGKVPEWQQAQVPVSAFEAGVERLPSLSERSVVSQLEHQSEESPPTPMTVAAEARPEEPDVKTRQDRVPRMPPKTSTTKPGRCNLTTMTNSQCKQIWKPEGR
jgi:hypothetical protein